MDGEPNELTQGLERLRLRLAQNPPGPDDVAGRQRNKEQVLAHLNAELALLAFRKAGCERRDAAEQEAHHTAAKLPSLQTLERILRYETKLERQLYRAMSQLERLQRMRQGEAVPPPLTMEVSDRP